MLTDSDIVKLGKGSARDRETLASQIFKDSKSIVICKDVYDAFKKSYPPTQRVDFQQMLFVETIISCLKNFENPSFHFTNSYYAFFKKVCSNTAAKMVRSVHVQMGRKFVGEDFLTVLSSSEKLPFEHEVYEVIVKRVLRYLKSEKCKDAFLAHIENEPPRILARLLRLPMKNARTIRSRCKEKWEQFIKSDEKISSLLNQLQRGL